MSYREPCPICNHPTGDCLGEEAHPVKIVGASVFPSLGYTDVYVVKEDVYYEQSLVQGDEETVPALIKQRIRFKKGQIISVTEARQFNLPYA